MGALPAKQNQFVEYAEKDAKMRSIADAIDSASKGIDNTQKMIAPEFSATTGYDVGKMVLYEGKLYRCISSHYGAWNSAHFEETNVDYNVSLNRIRIGNLYANIAQNYSANATYAVGDYVLYNYMLYVCNTAIETAEPWTAAHWTLVTHKLVNPLMEDIVDSDGHKRFFEIEGETEYISGVTITFNKASLSGSHIMFVIAGTIQNGGSFVSNLALGKFSVPQWVFDKIVPTWGTRYVEGKGVITYADDSSGQSVTAYLYKGISTVQILVGNATATAERHFRIQFDLMID